MATVLYNDRINTWRRMKQLDEQLDKNPTEQAVQEMAELRIRNLQAFAELQSLNDKGCFRFKHPLLSHRSELAELQRLRQRDPEEFLAQYKTVLNNLRRYRSYVNSDSRKDRRDKDQQLLDHYEQRKQLFIQAMEE